MAKQTVGELIREARTKAGLSQSALAAQLEGLSASELGRAERGEKELTQAQLKAIAKATGVTQKSLLDAASAAKQPAATAKNPASSAAKKPAASTAKKPAASSAKKPESAAVELTNAEKSLLNAWRKADAETRKAALKLLRGEKDEPDTLDTDDLLGTLLSGAMDMLGNLGKK